MAGPFDSKLMNFFPEDILNQTVLISGALFILAMAVVNMVKDLKEEAEQDERKRYKLD